MDSVYRGWAGEKGVGWLVVVAGGEPKASSSMHLTGKAAIVCPLNCTNSHSSLVRPGSTLTPIVASLVRRSGTTHSIVDCHEFTGPQK